MAEFAYGSFTGVLAEDSEEVHGVVGNLVFDDQTSRIVSMFGHVGKLPSTSKWIGAYTCLGPNGGRLALKVAASGTVKEAGFAALLQSPQ